MKKYIAPTTDISMIDARMSVLQSVSSGTGLGGFSSSVLSEYDVIK